MAQKNKDIEQAPLLPRIHVEEFLFNTDLSDMQKAGFKASIQGKQWMRPDEWQYSFDKYKSTL